LTVGDGPDQIERYLDHMRRYEGWPRGSLKGVLLQCAEDTSQAVVDRLRASRYTLELWSVIDEDDGGWYLDRLA
jgi:hypothetical protein